MTRRAAKTSTELRVRYARKTGELVGIVLEIGCEAPAWWKWTTSLSLAMHLRRAVLP